MKKLLLVVYIFPITWITFFFYTVIEPCIYYGLTDDDNLMAGTSDAIRPTMIDDSVFLTRQ